GLNPPPGPAHDHTSGRTLPPPGSVHHSLGTPCPDARRTRRSRRRPLRFRADTGDRGSLFFTPVERIAISMRLPAKRQHSDGRQPVTPEGRAVESHGRLVVPLRTSAPAVELRRRQLGPELKSAESARSLVTPDRQRERKRRALSRLALHPDPSAMQLNEL